MVSQVRIFVTVVQEEVVCLVFTAIMLLVVINFLVGY